MALEIQLFSGSGKIETGKKKILQDLGLELQVPAAPRWLCLGWSSLFPHWDLGLWLNQCSQHSREPSPVPTLPRSRDEAMGSWEKDYPGQLIKISRKTRGKKFWKGDLGSGNAWVGCGAFPITLGFFLHLFFPFL